MSAPVHSAAEAYASLMRTSEGRDILSYAVALDDLEAVIRSAPVAEATKEALIAGLKLHANGAQALPYYVFMLVIGELGEELEDDAGIRIVCNTIRRSSDRLPVIAYPGQTIH
ncbi:MAG TPA: hypothetical protein VD862_04110 [Candidatus Paceibacterota bacterium]|nr:hypothetical protein [Candidatus Paceibacterota bacterium]